jgi:hypothetical protein
MSPYYSLSAEEKT